MITRDLGDGLYVIDDPAGTYSLVGRVPVTPRTLRFREPTEADVRGGRIVERGGRRLGWTVRAFPSVAAAERAARHARGEY